MGNEDGSNIANLNEDMGEIAGPLIVNDTAKFQEDRPPRSYGIEIPPLARTRVVRGNAMYFKDLAGFVSMRRYHVAWYVPYSLLLKMMSNIFSYQLPQSSVVESFAANVLDAVRIVLVS